MVDVRKGDAVVLHGRALIDGLTVAPAIVTGTAAGDKITAKVQRGNGAWFDVPGVAQYGETSDLSNWWEWPKDEDGEAIEPTRAVDGETDPA